ncbi:MAG: lipid-A-disaccharide synthase, partial [Phormidesmis sp.]
GYRTVTYAEWDARWTGLVDCFAVMQLSLIEKAPAAHRHKFTVVGDLMADVQAIADRTAITTALGCAPDAELIGFLPGSKPAKLEIGVPMSLAIAQHLHAQRPSGQSNGQSNGQYVVGVAPNLTLADLTAYANSENNPAIALFNAPAVTLHQPETGLPYWQIENGPKIHLWQRFPSLDLFSQCQLCFTTVGAKTAQLGALAIPMIVLLPTQMLGAAQLADGWLGLVSRLPGMGAIARQFINPLIIKTLQKSGKRFAWPNIWAGREVVPELFGPITPADAADLALDYLTYPEKLATIRQTLRDLRGPAGAADKTAALILETVNYPRGKAVK